MQNFKCMKTALDVQAYLDELVAVNDAWSMSTGRQNKIKVQREALSIPLRGLRKSAINGRKRWDVHESRWTTGSQRFPLFVQFLNEFAEQQDAELGRAKIVCLPAGKRVYPHIDRGEYYKIRDRYHFVLHSTAGSWMRSGDEEVRMNAGELWWFDNNKEHEARNDGKEDRIHLIFDMLSKQNAIKFLNQAA